MICSRRHVMWLGGGVIASLAGPRSAIARTFARVEMHGSARGERVWFDPVGLWVAPGTSVRFTNRDPGNSHTATSYHPQIHDRKRRIPAGADPWDSGFLLPDEHFETTLSVPGVYDYYCLPHEMAAMVGRIVVGGPSDAGWDGPSAEAGDVPDQVLAALPPVEKILEHGMLRPEDRS